MLVREFVRTTQVCRSGHHQIRCFISALKVISWFLRFIWRNSLSHRRQIFILISSYLRFGCDSIVISRFLEVNLIFIAT